MFYIDIHADFKQYKIRLKIGLSYYLNNYGINIVFKIN
jgi:hypothetical protein